VTGKAVVFEKGAMLGVENGLGWLGGVRNGDKYYGEKRDVALHVK
jgi:hypothetical protein